MVDQLERRHSPVLDSINAVHLFTDGSCLGNGCSSSCPGGYAALLQFEVLVCLCHARKRRDNMLT